MSIRVVPIRVPLNPSPPVHVWPCVVVGPSGGRDDDDDDDECDSGGGGVYDIGGR